VFLHVWGWDFPFVKFRFVTSASLGPHSFQRFLAHFVFPFFPIFFSVRQMTFIVPVVQSADPFSLSSYFNLSVPTTPKRELLSRRAFFRILIDPVTFTFGSYLQFASPLSLRKPNVEFYVYTLLCPLAAL